MTEPALWKLAPAVVLKPWGLVHEGADALAGIRVGVGEFWLASAQTGPGNYSNAVAEPALGRTLAELLDEAAGDEEALAALLGEPVLQHLAEHVHRGKTEAWCIRAAQGRTGVVAGPRTREDATRLEELIRSEGLAPRVEGWPQEVRRLFGVVEPLEGGEVFLAPAGTLHTMFAVGPGSRLIIDEIQQGYGESRLPTLSKILGVQDNLLSVQVHPDDETVAAAAEGEIQIEQDLQANPTVRIYDFGRRPGEYPELGFRLVDPGAGLRFVPSVQVDVAEGHAVEVLVATPYFVKSRVRLAAGREGGLAPLYGGYRVLHCLKGEVGLRAGDAEMELARGETAFVPACLEEELRLSAASDCVVFDDALPRLEALTGFLGRRGAATGAIEALLAPPRAVE